MSTVLGFWEQSIYELIQSVDSTDPTAAPVYTRGLFAAIVWGTAKKREVSFHFHGSEKETEKEIDDRRASADTNNKSFLFCFLHKSTTARSQRGEAT